MNADLLMEIENRESVQSIEDVKVWAKVCLDIELRKKQEAVLACEDNRSLLIAGRRTGKSTTVKVGALHKAFTEPGAMIIIAVAWDMARRVMFNDLMGLINENQDMKALVERTSLNSGACRIDLSNGSSIRVGHLDSHFLGLRADYMFFDEIRNSSREAIRSSRSIASKKVIICTSVANAEVVLYELEDLFTSFHFPSTELDHWNDDMELEFLSSLSGALFKKEILALY